MTESRLSAADPGRARPPQTVGSGPGSGWVAFAGVMLLLVGAFNVVVGLVALFRSGVFVAAPSGVLVFSITGWGWIHLIGGILLFITGLGVFSGNAIARVAAVVLAGLNAIAQLTFLPVYPLWAIVVIVLDVVVIAAVLSQGTTPVSD
ncbi:hypothetical protein LQ327_32480 [Actinomycetospora endophytica]|uniref:DUF7144 domain-containing protein n=1 Tax=Actinomycetospora endophytica TaxID=2291215 RepID=A0ABS8PIK3_9PSEU|nr:hypothetical protein [Actinomycetospora endophytica]MCD2198098.1 hypothetical protein [Actinomycetospora endophytica]